MTEPSREAIESAIAGYVDPYLEQDLVTAGRLREVSIEGGDVRVEIALGFPAQGHRRSLIESIESRVASVPGVERIRVVVGHEVVAHAAQKGVRRLENVRNIIAVASGKGGVGKSTTAVNLALALSLEGGRVGILDADIYGPSQPRMLGVHDKPKSRDGRSMEPVVAHGLQTMSIGYLVDEETPMIWRGPMVTQALEQLLRETNWSDLDYLVIDLPPGTGDTQLTLAQKIPVSGAVIVTTPQDIALIDARKAYRMFEKVDVPVLGVVENMSTHVCSRCGHEEAIFGAGGAERMASEYGLPLLGSLPLDRQLREGLDDGRPIVVSDPEHALTRRYREIALRIAAGLSRQGRDYSTRFPEIVIEEG